MKISNCDDCIESLKQMGAAGSDEQHKETCSQEGKRCPRICEEFLFTNVAVGDSYYCNCDS